MVLGEQYKQKRLEANRITDPAARQAKLAEFERDYRTPAIQYLKLGSGSRMAVPRGGRAAGRRGGAARSVRSLVALVLWALLISRARSIVHLRPIVH